MTDAPMNPFRPTRWEHHREGQQLIWYSEFADTIAAEKSFYINGSRGSGKTTLLRSICWEDLARNTSLRMQKTISEVANIGCYIRFPDHLTSSLSAVKWSKVYPQAPDPELELHRYFSLLVELTCAERAISACHELRVGGFAKINPSSEIEFSELIFTEFRKLKEFADRDGGAIRSLPGVCHVFRTIAREMNQAAGRGTIREMNDRLPAREPGELLAFIAKNLAEIVSLKTSDNYSRRPGFKFCLDDCEVLNTPQQISVNTLVRICKSPVSWVVSYVGSQFEDSKTYIDRQSLSDADRRVESLDQRSKETFRELCQAVVSLRLLFDVSETLRTKRRVNKIEKFFSLERRLGTRSVNEMFDIIVRRSASPLARAVKECAELLRDKLPSSMARGEASSFILPYYQAYTLLHWQPGAGSFKVEFTEVDKTQLLSRAATMKTAADEAWLRRKQRAALLHFASSVNTRSLPLAGKDIIVSLADGSIRDFLEILGFIYEAYTKHHRLDVTSRESLDKFAASGSQISGDIQTAGIYNASNAYHAGVGARAEKDFDVVLRIIEGLGHYTSLLQSDRSDPSVLGRAERGIFNIRFEATGPNAPVSASERERTVWNTVRHAELSGYVRTVDATTRDVINSEEPNGSSLVIRLHRRFSPHYRFSYRGPYEILMLNASDLWQLCDRNAPIEPRAWAEAIAGKTTIDQQISLSFEWDRIDD